MSAVEERRYELAPDRTMCLSCLLAAPEGSSSWRPVYELDPRAEDWNEQHRIELNEKRMCDARSRRRDPGSRDPEYP